MQRIVNPQAHRWIGPKTFYIEAILVMLPAVLQQMANSIFNFTDNLMIGRVDAQTLAGVAVANKFYLIFSGLFWGITGAGAMLIAQYHGADDRDECERLFSLQIVVGLLIALGFVIIMTIFPSQIIGWFVKDQVTLQHGLDYLRIARFSYFPAALTMVGLFSMRAIAHNRLPLAAGITGMVVNLFLNWVLIFGHFGYPAMGAKGAAIAVLIARLVEASFYIFWIGIGKTLFSWNLWSLRYLSAPVAKMAFHKTLPLTINEFFYSVGLSLTFWALSQIKESAIPAFVIADQAIQLLLVVFGGMATGITVMVGQRLGAGQFDQARIHARLHLVFQSALALLMSIVVVIAAPWVTQLFAIPDDLKIQATWMIWIQAFFLTPALAYAVVFFTLRSGGDMRSAFIVDALMMWLLPIPAAVVLAIFLPEVGTVGLLLAYASIQFLQNIRIFPALHYFRQEHWVKNLTTVSHSHSSH
ncbi:MAG: MATE family efflux transporter [Eubacteriales bacterium]|nr:MATE family efflux transporter [Eubacteriales bacterium]